MFILDHMQHLLLIKLNNKTALRRSQGLLDQLKCCFFFDDVSFFSMGSSKIFWTTMNLKSISKIFKYTNPSLTFCS